MTQWGSQLVFNCSNNTSKLSCDPLRGEFEQVDLYGRRDILDGAVIGYFSDASDVADTLTEDMIFDR